MSNKFWAVSGELVDALKEWALTWPTHQRPDCKRFQTLDSAIFVKTFTAAQAVEFKLKFGDYVISGPH